MLSSPAFTVLRRLADGAILPSHSLSGTTGLSRARVRAAIDEAAAAGVPVAAVRGRGFRLAAPIDFLDADRLEEILGPLAPRLDVTIVDATGSTNSDLMAQAASGPIHGRVRVAELQTAGRGRRGETWKAVLGGSLTASLGWTFALPAAALGGLSLAVGVAAVRAIAAAGIPGVTLKWPNDLLWNFQKVGGILVETVAATSEAPTTAVIGVGINVRLPDAVRDEIARPATDLARIAGRPVDRTLLLARLLRELVAVLERFAEHGFGAVHAEWDAIHAYRDRAVVLRHANGGVTEGTVVGVDDDGALLLARPAGTERFLAGDVSLRT